MKEATAPNPFPSFLFFPFPLGARETVRRIVNEFGGGGIDNDLVIPWPAALPPPSLFLLFFLGGSRAPAKLTDLQCRDRDPELGGFSFSSFFSLCRQSRRSVRITMLTKRCREAFMSSLFSFFASSPLPSEYRTPPSWRRSLRDMLQQACSPPLPSFSPPPPPFFLCLELIDEGSQR